MSLGLAETSQRHVTQYILFAAIIAGTLTGIFFTGIQQLQVIPLIQQAQTYESGESVEQHGHANSAHDNGETLGRHLSNLRANVLAGIGFALLLASAIILSKHTGWRKGVYWGVAGYLCFFVAPALGLAPKLPGTIGAQLDYRQAWWVATVTTTAIGLGLLIFAKHILLKSLGLVFIAMPHVIGAPLPEEAYSSAPEQLGHDFIVASAMANAAFWIVLGTLSGYLQEVLFKRIPAKSTV